MSVAVLFPERTQQPGFQWPQPLSEKYRPRRIADFVGLEKPKRILSRFRQAPYGSAWVLVGPAGVGKTTMALALADEMRAELHHIPSQKCTVESVEDTVRRCWYVPMSGGFHLVLVDEADQMSPAAQLALLSKLDSTASPPATVWVFTCNCTDRLETRFLSRCRVIEFSSYGMAQAAADLLRLVWDAEVGSKDDGNGLPNFARIVKESCNNIRDCLMQLETLILEA